MKRKIVQLEVETDLTNRELKSKHKWNNEGFWSAFNRSDNVNWKRRCRVLQIKVNYINPKDRRLKK